MEVPLAAEPKQDQTPALLNSDLCCFGCAYNLRSQPLLGRCPECGLEVEQTLHRLAALDVENDPRRIKRAAIYAIAAVVTPVLFMFGISLVAALAFSLIDGEYFEILLLTAAAVTTIGTGWFIYRAARMLTKETGPVDVNRRVLGPVGWIVPALIAALWVLGMASDRLDLELPEVIPLAMGITCLLAASLFPITLLLEMCRRVQQWPIWQALATSLRIVVIALAMSLAILWAAAGLQWLDSEYDLGVYEELSVPIDIVTGTAGVVLAVAMVGFLATLIATLLGLRRLRRLGYIQDSDQRQGLDRDSLLALIQKIRQERQLAPVVPQRLQVQ